MYSIFALYSNIPYPWWVSQSRLVSVPSKLVYGTLYMIKFLIIKIMNIPNKVSSDENEIYQI